MRSICFFLLVVFGAALSPLPWAGGSATLHAEEVKENYPDGAKKLKYSLDKEGKRHGSFVQYFQNGKTQIKASYRHGELYGKYFEKIADSNLTIHANYKAGKLDGTYKQKDGKHTLTTQKWKNGVLKKINGIVPYPKSVEDINKTLRDILAGSYDTLPPRVRGTKKKKKKKKKSSRKDVGKATEKPADPLWDARMNALRSLQAYRYLCDVPYQGMYLDPLLNRYTDAAAKICAALGHLEHKPRNPGWSKDEYDFAYKGTSSSNLYMYSLGGSVLMAESVPGYMDDSDPHNISRLGHRRWCLNPGMLKTGFGWFKSFSAMWSFDRSRKSFGKKDFIAYPPMGYLPIGYFSTKHAWSISFNPGRMGKVMNKNLQARVFRLDKNYAPVGEALPLNYHHLAPASYGSGDCLIFRSKNFEVTPGARYWVEVYAGGSGSDKGKKKRKKRRSKKGAGGELLLRYLVEFIK